MRRALRLTRWLGPWTPTAQAPSDVERATLPITTRSGTRFDAWVFGRRDRRFEGAVLLVPGLHYAGPSDARLTRFASVLAHAGYLVLTPFLPTYTSLRVEPEVVEEIEASFDALLAHPERPPHVRPGVFSISFGSMPALRLAALRPREIERVIVFGGFASFRKTLAFALRGEGPRATDPLNAPAVVTNVLPFLGETDGLVGSEASEALRRAMLAYCAATWGRPEMRIDRAYVAVAHSLAASLEGSTRELFLCACRVEPGIEPIVERALARAGSHFDWIDPAPSFRAIEAPVTLVHGVDDDVIPCEESFTLLRALRPHTRAELHLTGLYGHTQVEGVRHGPVELARELRSMVRIVESMAALSGR